MKSLKDFYYIDIEEKIVLKKFIDSYLDKDGKIICTPNRITTMRGILVIPGILLIFSNFTGNIFFAEVIIAIALWMDRLDGAVAKNRNLSTTFGKVYDPAMDKVTELLIFSSFIVFYKMMTHADISIYLYSIILYLGSQAMLFVISIYKYRIIKGHPTKYILEQNEGANNFGKSKTFVSFTWILVNIPMLKSGINPNYFAPVFLVSFVLAVLSGISHLKAIQNK